jgi:hypothetical protein
MHIFLYILNKCGKSEGNWIIVYYNIHYSFKLVKKGNTEFPQALIVKEQSLLDSINHDLSHVINFSKLHKVEEKMYNFFF